MVSERSLRIAVIGAGPAGVYATDALARATPPAHVDVIDALPTPYGLVRYGVAPDHVKMKSVIRVLHGVLDLPNVRFIGNVQYGLDFDLADLHKHYDASIFATGSPTDRHLGIEGEDRPGSIAAADVVAWYSGLPGAVAPPLTARDVVVIGAGNVALDVARFFAKGSAGFERTDVPDAVFAALADAATRNVHIVARRGPAQAKFTQVELREMGQLDDVDTIVDPDQLTVDAAADSAMAEHKATRTMFGYFQEWATRTPPGRPKRVYFHFYRRPVRMLGDGARGPVTGIELGVGRPDGEGGVIDTGETEHLAAQLVIRSIGYRGLPLDGLPFDAGRDTIPNDAGRIAGRTGEYVAGWIKRGPTGVIGTNKGDARQTVQSILADAATGTLPLADRSDDADLAADLRDAGVEVVEWDGWLRIDAHEIALGRDRGRDRTKVDSLQAMLDAASDPATRA
ncbi:MAG: FAD-dependent oxidoreductase [Mycobacteriales bacterium]